ncbi:cytosine/creatinine deaminase [Thermostichus sp. MS-CIW-23]
MPAMQIPGVAHYWLLNAQVPLSVLKDAVPGAVPNRDNLVLLDLEIEGGQIRQIRLATGIPPQGIPSVDLRRGQVWPCFVDIHTHLDKGHVWPRTPNPDGTFAGARQAGQEDWVKMKQAYDGDPEQFREDLYRRFSFGLRCSYAHGSQAVRTHLVCENPQVMGASWEVFVQLRREWAGKLELQAVTLLSLDAFLTPAAEKLADKVAEVGGILGGVAAMGPELDRQLDRVFALAKERGLALDFHTDETDDPGSLTLRHVAAAALRHEFSGQVVCGHCCSLAVQPPEVAHKTMALVREAGIAVVSLPMCNLYLQARNPGHTPRWRGVTLLHELKALGVPVMIASDNCRDPFYGFGDHDGLEVFREATRILHLDTPYGDWPQAITTTPARIMGLTERGQIGVGLPADLVLFKGRGFDELLSRPQHDRVVLRQGQAIDTTLPDYSELDDLMEKVGTALSSEK